MLWDHEECGPARNTRKDVALNGESGLWCKAERNVRYMYIYIFFFLRRQILFKKMASSFVSYVSSVLGLWLVNSSRSPERFNTVPAFKCCLLSCLWLVSPEFASKMIASSPQNNSFWTVYSWLHLQG